MSLCGTSECLDEQTRERYQLSRRRGNLFLQRRVAFETRESLPAKRFDFSDFTAHTKEDGSLVLLFFLAGAWRATTTGGARRAPGTRIAVGSSSEPTGW